MNQRIMMLSRLIVLTFLVLLVLCSMYAVVVTVNVANGQPWEAMFTNKDQTVSANHTFTGNVTFTQPISGTKLTWEGMASSPSTSATRYVSLTQSPLVTPGTTESISDGSLTMTVINGKFTTLHVCASVAPGAGKNWVVTLRRAGGSIGQTPQDTLLTANIADSNTCSAVATSSVVFSPTDWWSLRIVPSGTPASATLMFAVAGLAS